MQTNTAYSSSVKPRTFLISVAALAMLLSACGRPTVRNCQRQGLAYWEKSCVIQPVVNYSACIRTVRDDYRTVDIGTIVNVSALKMVETKVELKALVDSKEVFTSNLSSENIDKIRNDCSKFIE